MEVRRTITLCLTGLLLPVVCVATASAQYPYAPATRQPASHAATQYPGAELWAPQRVASRDVPPRLASSLPHQAAVVEETSGPPVSGADYPVGSIRPAAAEFAETGEVGSQSLLDADSCCSMCVGMPACRKPWHVVAGVEATYLQPRVGDTPLLHLAPNGRVISSELADLDDYYAAPRVWLGMENHRGHGVRARYWDFDASAWDYDTVIVPLGQDAFDIQTFDATSRLEAYTIDLEYTRRFALGRWLLLGSIGARHAKFSRAESLDGFTTDLLSGPVPLGVATQIISERSINATGLTLGLEGLRPLKHWNLNFFWNVRGSVLWGDNRSNNVSSVYVAPVGLQSGAVAATNILVLEETDMLYILDVQSGIEWRHRLKCCCAEMFARVAVEYQYWDAEESGGDYLTQIVVDVDPINFGETRDMRANFIGMAFSFGIAW